MAALRAGQKRKVVEVPRPSQLHQHDHDEVTSQGGEWPENIEHGSDQESWDDDDEEDGLSDDELDTDSDVPAYLDDDGLGSDEVPSSDEGDEDEDGDKLAQKLMGSDTAVEISQISADTPVRRLAADARDDAPDHRIETDANGNVRYVHREIDPVYDSDDSDAPPTANTIGDIPLSYYDAYPHIGYDINGRRITRPAKGAALDSLLDSIDIPQGWTGLTDPDTGKPMRLTGDELRALKQLTRNETPGDGYDPYPDMVEYFTGKGMEEVMPLSAAPEPKRRFVPSMHEHKRVMKMVKAIKDGRIKPYREPTEEDREREERAQEFASYDIWSNERPRADHPMNIPAPKLPPPGYEESYHPPPEYLPDRHERAAWEAQDEEDRERDFLPQDHSALRKVPGYARFVKDKFERCLDLYLAPRVRRSKLDIDPESLLPKLPDPQDLKPFPTTCATTYLGHKGRVRSTAIDPTGKYVASGGDDGTVRVWELLTGRQLWHVLLSPSDAVNVVVWRPGLDALILSACCGDSVHFIVPQGELCDPETEARSREVVDAGFGHAASNPSKTTTAAGEHKPATATWARPPPALQDRGVLLTLTLRSTPKTLAWHRRGDYFSTVAPSTSATSTAVAIHTLSKHQTQHPFKRLRGLAQTACFHPARPLFFVATRQRVRVYDLQQQKLERELQPGARWISDVALHPHGSHLLVSSYDKRLLWHDLDLGPTPYKTLRYHSRAIRAVAFHPTRPLFADASDDASLQVFHALAPRDSLDNPAIVPLKVLRGHAVRADLGVLALDWHPREPWCVSAGADGTVRLWT